MAELIGIVHPIAELESSGYTPAPSGEIKITENHKTFDVSRFERAVVDVPDPVLVDKTINENGEYNSSSDDADGYKKVTVALPFERKEVEPSTVQQTVIPTPDTEYQALSEVVVKPTPLDSLKVSIDTGKQIIRPESPFLGFSEVMVEGYLPEECQGIDMLSFEAHKGYRQSNGSISGNGTDPNWVWFDPVDVGCKTQVIFRLWGYPTVMSLMVWNGNNEIIDTVHISSGSTYFYNKYSIPTGAKKIGVSCFSTITRADQMCVLI